MFVFAYLHASVHTVFANETFHLLIALCLSSPARKAELGISSFGVSVTTMEEVFMKVGGIEETLETRWVGGWVGGCGGCVCVSVGMVVRFSN